MEITWLGYSCFRLKGKNVTVITDPCPPEIGYSLDKAVANIVTISHKHLNHSYIQGISGEPRQIISPGEYEVGGVLIIGLPSFHDSDNGKTLGKNTVYAIEIDDVTVCHLGDIGSPLSAAQIEELGNVDILLIPVGGINTISASQAAALVRSIEPKIVVPMHYKTLTLTRDIDNVDKFLKEMGVSQLVPQPKLTVTKSALPLTTTVITLSC